MTSIDNYTVGKGLVSFKKTGGAAFVDMGNCTEFEFTPEIEKLDHFSSRTGVRFKDKSVVIQKSGTLRLVLDEWTVDNLKMAVLGSSAVVSGAEVIQIFQRHWPQVRVAVSCRGLHSVLLDQPDLGRVGDPRAHRRVRCRFRVLRHHHGSGGCLMVSLVDIAPVNGTVTVRGQDITVTGVSAKGVAHLLARFPELRALITGRDVALEQMIRLGGEVVAAIIAAGIGHPGEEHVEAAVDNLTLEEQVDVLADIFRMTMPNGVGPFVEKLSALGIGGPGVHGVSATRAPTSRKPSRN
jgi:hypothetical protein